MKNEEKVLPIFKELKVLKDNEIFVLDKSGVKLVEILGVQFNLNPEQPYFKFPGRETSKDYVEAELTWYNSQDLSIDYIGQKAKIWTQVCSEDNLVNSNYGWCIFSEENGEQYKNCFKELIKNPASRRAIMIYTRPSMHNDYCKNGMNDFICTNTVQCFIRNNCLLYHVHMRSNDAIFGFMNDFYWHCQVYKKLLTDIQKVYPEIKSNLNSGMHWTAESFHIYERHFEMLDKICEYHA